MAYTPPVGTVDLDLTGSYTPPVGTVDLDLGATALPERTAVIAGETLAPTGAIAVVSGPVGSVAGETLAPTGSIRIVPVVMAALAGETLAPTGRIQTAYDPNLLSAVHSLIATAWQDGETALQGVQEALQDAPDLRVGPRGTWQTASLLDALLRSGWRDSPRLTGAGRAEWQEASGASIVTIADWKDSPRLEHSSADCWQDADARGTGIIQVWRPRLPMPDAIALPNWQDGEILTTHFADGMRDGLLTLVIEVEVWQQAGYPGNAPNPGPPIPPIIPWPWGTNLDLRCPLPGTTLRIGRSPCILVAEREIPVRRTYMTTNTAALVRWPDLTPLPVTSMTVETDFDSWCWALTATLAGPEAWELVQPNPLACQVQATINGQIWRFLLDVPSQNRSFNSDRVTLKGRSRSAWLHDPYTPARNFSQTQAREMQQLGEAALENTGWTLDWQGANWVVPAGRYQSWNTPIGALIRLANVTDDGVYTHPWEQIITLHKRWPVASWLVDGETATLAVPDAAILSLTQSPIYTQPLNGVYVSGISHGVLALVKIVGTDGALQPAEPITDELLCDEAGVAARQRGLNALSDSGAGWEMDAETLFAPNASPAFPLVPPGQIVSIAGMKGISRSCRIVAQRSGGALSVRQMVGLERREMEAA